MYKHCPASCELLRLENKNSGQQQQQQQSECLDKHPHCRQWAKLGECKENMDVRNHCPKSCEACPADCADTHENCQFWANAGECKVSRVFSSSSVVVSSLNSLLNCVAHDCIISMKLTRTHTHRTIPITWNETVPCRVIHATKSKKRQQTTKSEKFCRAPTRN